MKKGQWTIKGKGLLINAGFQYYQLPLKFEVIV
jgi:hypothetical protein